MSERNASDGYEFVEDIAIADVAFHARGATLAADGPEMLLFELLQELIYYKDAEELLLLPETLRIEQTASGWAVRATLAGERIDRGGRHRLDADVKAVTMHEFAVRRTSDGWQASVVLDI